VVDVTISSGNLRQLHQSRYGYTTRTFEVTVNHKRQCMGATRGFYGSYNDKTIVRFDGLVQDLHLKRRYHDIT
jgi:hypothetical protein